MSTLKVTDEVVKKLIAAVVAKKQEIANAERPTYITGGNFHYSEGVGNSIDVTTVRDERKLVEILGFLKDRSANYSVAAIELGCEVSFTWLGFTVEEWSKDLKTRVNILQLTKRKAELAELEKRVNGLISEDLRKQLEMEAIAKELGITAEELVK